MFHLQCFSQCRTHHLECKQDKLNESQDSGQFHDYNDNQQQPLIQFDINKLLITTRKIIKKTLDQHLNINNINPTSQQNKKQNNSNINLLTKLIKNSENKISSHLNNLESYLYSIDKITNTDQLHFLSDLGISLNLLFLQIQSELTQSNTINNNNNNASLYPRANPSNLYPMHSTSASSFYHSFAPYPHGPPQQSQQSQHGFMSASSIPSYYQQRRSSINLSQNIEGSQNQTSFDIEVSLCDSILVCCVEIYLIVLENCNNDEQICTDHLGLLEKLLIIGPEIRQPYDWLNCNVTHLKQKYLKLKYFGFGQDDMINNNNNRKNNNNNHNDKDNDSEMIEIIDNHNDDNNDTMDIDGDDDIDNDKKDKDKKKKKKIEGKNKKTKSDDDDIKINIDIPSFTEIKLKKAIKMNDIKDNDRILSESSMNRISQISRLDNRNLFSYIIDSNDNNTNNESNDNQSQQTITFKQNDRIKLLNEWIFDVFNQSNGIQRLLSICLKRMDNFIKKSQNDDMHTIEDEDEEKKKSDDNINQQSVKDNLQSYEGRKYILLHLENILSMLDILFCIISLNGNNKKLFEESGPISIEINVFISYLCTIFNKISSFHLIINESVIELIEKFSTEFNMNRNKNKKMENKPRYCLESEQIEIKYLMEISSHFEQMIDMICKLLHLPFLAQHTMIRRYIAIQCKIAFNRQIVYLFAKISDKHSNIHLNKEYLSLFAGDPKLVEPLLTNLAKNNQNDIFHHSSNNNYKPLTPQQITTNREILCAFIATNFYCISKIHAPIHDLSAMPNIQISSKKGK